MATAWMYSRNGHEFGPVSSKQLKQLAATQELTPEDLVWKEGMKRWARADAVKGLFDKPILAMNEFKISHTQEPEGKLLTFNCPHCDLALNGTREKVSRLMSCPQCAGQFSIPENVLTQLTEARPEKRKPPLWFYDDGTELRGPLTKLQLIKLADSGTLNRHHRVSCDNATWVEAANVEGLFPPPPIQVAPPKAKEVSSSTMKEVPPPQAPNNSKLVNCPDCDSTVSKRASVCPACGCPLKGAAVESRLTFYRVYQENGSVWNAFIYIDGVKQGVLSVGEGTTVVLDDGQFYIRIEIGGMFGPKEIFSDRLTIEAGEHLIFEFNPFGGFWNNKFEFDLKEKLS